MQEKNSERLKMSPYQPFSHYIRDVDGAIKSQSGDTDLRSIRLSAAQVLKECMVQKMVFLGVLF